MNIRDLPTPFVVIDRARVRANIAAMQTLATGAGVALRPHAKTHKSPAIARWQLEAGAVGICCAKLAEAEVFAEAGVTNIRLPYPVNPSNGERVRALLAQGVTLSIIVDDLEVARGWSRALAGSGHRLDVLVKVDVGFHRCGIDPDSPRALETIKGVRDLSGLSFRGLLSHAGHSYGAGSAHELAQVADAETFEPLPAGRARPVSKSRKSVSAPRQPRGSSRCKRARRKCGRATTSSSTAHRRDWARPRCRDAPCP